MLWLPLRLSSNQSVALRALIRTTIFCSFALGPCAETLSWARRRDCISRGRKPNLVLRAGLACRRSVGRGDPNKLLLLDLRIADMSARPSEREEALLRRLRAAEKKLRQIAELKEWRDGGKRLDEGQVLKLQGEKALAEEIAAMKAMIIELREAPLSNVGKDTPQLRSSNTVAPPTIPPLPASSTLAAAAACAS